MPVITPGAEPVDTDASPARRCHRCRHYFITHELPFRYGCRALDFKSRRQPGLDVLTASGQVCLYFRARQL